MSYLSGLPVLVLGLGASGLAMARWCDAHGARVVVWDSRDEPPQAAALAADVPAARRTTALPASLADADAPKLILKSPGLSPHDARVAPLLQQARATGVAVLGELDLFVRGLADRQAATGYAPKLLAVTGTNGKTTTTAMTALLVGRTGRSVVAAGNIGPTLLDTLASRGDDLPDVWVLELSSFQLDGGGDGVRGFEPDAATVLNVTQDHLDWHGSMDAYAQAKARVFGSRATLVVNRDDARVEAMVPAPAAAALKGRGKDKARETAPLRDVVRFGTGAPTRPGDYGIVVEQGMAWLVRALPNDEPAPARRRPRTVAAVAGAGDVAVAEVAAAVDAAPDLHLQRLMPADALRVRGRHNAANALAALALAGAIGCPLAPMLHGLREYAGEPHRVAWIGTVDDVEAYDDSKGTNVGATVAALDGLGADKSPARLVVILGGDGKGQDFAPLADPLARHARAVATIGRDAAAIEAAIAPAVDAAALPLQRHAGLDDAVAWCFAQARPGDAVLLSPACASLDMFRDYGHRAEVFAAAVRALAADRGQA